MINEASEAATNTVNRTLNELQDTAQTAIEQSKADRDRHRHRDAGNPQHAARRHHRAVRAAARSQHHAAGSAQRRAREHERARKHAGAARVGIRHRHERGHRARPARPPTRWNSNISDVPRHHQRRCSTDLGQLASQFDAHGRELAEAVELIDRSNRRTEDTVNERRVTLDSLVATLDIRTEDLEQRLKRFSGLLDESLEAASARARDIARMVAESSAEGTRAISEQYERVREHAEDERRRTAEAMRAIYEQTAATPTRCSATPTSASPRRCRA